MARRFEFTERDCSITRISRAMEELDAEGWEVVAVVRYEGSFVSPSGYTVFAKRELRPGAAP